MATIRLIPSTYAVSSTSYLSVSNASNMYANTDNTTYATVTNSQTGTTSYYLYIRGFNFDDIPSSAIVNSFTVKLKARESGVSTSSSYAPKLINNTSQLTSTCSALSTTATVLTFTGVSADWDEIIGYGSNFGIRINCRRASRNTTGYVYVYGAEIEVDYTVPNPRTITTTLSGDGTISPSGSNTYYDGDEFELTITPTNTNDTVTATKDGVDITSQLVAHGTETSASTVLGGYTLVSGGFNGSGASYFSGLEGNGVDASQTTSNYYSSSSSTQAVFKYDLNFSGIPSNATITRLYCQVNGHAESTSQSNEYMCVQLISGTIELSEEINFKNVSTSNTTITLEADTLPTIPQLANLALQCTLGYYGGAINGATTYIEYDIPSSGVTHYTYTYTVSGNSTIVVTIGSSSTQLPIRVKQNGTWVIAKKLFVKQNGTWVQSTTIKVKNNGTWK